MNDFWSAVGIGILLVLLGLGAAVSKGVFSFVQADECKDLCFESGGVSTYVPGLYCGCK